MKYHLVTQLIQHVLLFKYSGIFICTEHGYHLASAGMNKIVNLTENAKWKH